MYRFQNNPVVGRFPRIKHIEAKESFILIDKRLLSLVPSSKKYIALTVLCYLLSLVANVIFIFFIGNGLNSLFEQGRWMTSIWLSFLLMAGVFLLRYIATLMSTKYSYLASSKVKSILRRQIYQKVLVLGTAYNEKISTSDLIQTSLEGVEQLEIYFSRYLPQLFYSFLAPIFLFVLIFPISAKPAIVLLACVPLIPISIMAVYKIAGKLFKKYWGLYVNMGNGFLDNIRGLTTLKTYLADERKHKEMNDNAEHFRVITMKVLTMQLNSTTIMDFIAFGGAGLGALFTLLELQKGTIGIAQSFVIIMLSAEFFIPLRRLGSFFHIAMNGMSAKKKIFALLDLSSPQRGDLDLQGENIDISMKNLAFSYDENREILKDVSIRLENKSFVSIVGGSGSGKSTIASLITGRYWDYEGNLEINGFEQKRLSADSIAQYITIIGHDSYLFSGTVRENLLMSSPAATDEEMYRVLKQVRLYEFLMEQEGLDTLLSEGGSNFSGGQRQRLALARAILHNTPMYIFDEATSNIDSESEEYIMDVIKSLAKEKTVLLISHRLENVVDSDRIYVLDQGVVEEQGSHNDLLKKKGIYERLYRTQKNMERIDGGVCYE